MNRIWIAAIALGLSGPAFAQEAPTLVPAQEPSELVVKKMAVDKLQVEGALRAKLAVEARTTTGAPYSAEAVTETVQTLADGNRINRKTTTRVYRDSEGRTRREEMDDSGEVVSLSIVDPPGRVSYVLQPRTRTAYRGGSFIARAVSPSGKQGPLLTTDAEKRSAEVAARAKLDAEQAHAAGSVVYPAPPPPPPPPPPAVMGMKLAAGIAGDGTKEDLGRQMVEGVGATGTRTTWTIAAGAIGNLQPIKIVSEQWFSPDLQLLVLTKHSDPRSGETTYRLQNIVRAEPDRSLFMLPADYTLKESGIRKK
jgi:hypothetical protein